MFNFDQQQQSQIPFQMNQQGFQPQVTIQQQRQQNQQAHLINLQQTLKKIYDIQNQPQLQHLVQVLQTQQKVSNEFIKKTMDQTDIKAINVTQMQNFVARGNKIRTKNAKLMSRLLLVKGKLQRLMYHDMNQHSKYQYETSHVMDKIRGLKSQITQKCAYLKTLKINRSEDLKQNRNQSKNKNNFSNIGAGLTQLKHGTQILQREVLKQKAQMEFIIKQLNDNS